MKTGLNNRISSASPAHSASSNPAASSATAPHRPTALAQQHQADGSLLTRLGRALREGRGAGPQESLRPRFGVRHVAQSQPQPYGGQQDLVQGQAQAMPALSAHKQAFMAAVAKDHAAGRPPGLPERLSFRELKQLADGYQQTDGSHIHIAGEVLPDLLRRLHGQLEAQWLGELDTILAAPDAGMKLLELCWGDVLAHQGLRDLDLSAGRSDPTLRQVLAARVEGNRLGLRDRLLELASGMRQQVTHQADRFGLCASEGVRELQALAANPGGRAHGYLFPTNVRNRSGNGHAEAFVVSSTGKVINIIPHPPQGAPVVPGQYTAGTEAVTLGGLQVSAQETIYGCGTLGMSYLKQYLKDDARDLNQNSLLVDFLHGDGMARFHLPSPQVLGYSQSDLYPRIMRAVVAGDAATVQVQDGDIAHEVRTLRGLALAGACITRPDGVVVTQNLDAFRTAWLSQWDARATQRALMQLGGRNHYVAYTAARLARKAGGASNCKEA